MSPVAECPDSDPAASASWPEEATRLTSLLLLRPVDSPAVHLVCDNSCIIKCMVEDVIYDSVECGTLVKNFQIDWALEMLSSFGNKQLSIL